MRLRALNYPRSWTVFLLLLAGCGKSGPPYSQKEALKTFQIDPAYRIEPFVCEPAVVSPVAMEFDENGRIFVIEDRGYPLSPEQHLGRVKLLEDTNGDGIPDRSTIFADQLTMPTGAMRWKRASWSPMRRTCCTSKIPMETAKPIFAASCSPDSPSPIRSTP